VRIHSAADVIEQAIRLARRRRFDCPYCAIAEAQGMLCRRNVPETLPDMLRKLATTAECLRQYVTGEVIPLDEDAPLEAARMALFDFRDEIASCPSRVTKARCVEMLVKARANLQSTQEETPA